MPDTFSNMTTLQAMHDNLVKTMQYLDTVLPKGSHILLTGLANGSVLYDELSDRLHPLGRVKNDVKYPSVYTYLSCLEVSATKRRSSRNIRLLDICLSILYS